MLAVWLVAGLIGIWFSHRTGFPGAWDARISHTQRFLVPVALGLAFGVVLTVFDVITGYTAFLANLYGLPSANIEFPANVLIYPAGAIIVEVLYRLLPLPLLLWLISNVLLRGRAQETVFWILAVVTSLQEPLSQDLAALPMGPVVFGLKFAQSFGFNFAQAVVFRRYGFLAAIVVRVAMYVIWHMIYAH
jgi:hypothetical protein